jgi:PKD repeat protein
MNKRNNQIATTHARGPKRAARGFTLLEALVAIAVLGFGFATTMAFHGELLGSAGENRMRSTAMSLAEARLEALRAVPFDNLVAGSYEETLSDIDAFGFFSLRPVSLTRCWVIEDEPSLKRVRVAVARSGETCAPWGDDALVTLTSRIADNDYARAGVKTLADSLYDPDGLGDIAPISVTTGDKAGAPEIPGGFDVRDLDPEGEYGAGFALCDASSGTCLVPEVDEDDGSQNFSTLSGNIFLSDRSCSTGDGSLAERCGLDLVIEGNALCRLHFPDDSVGGVPPALPGATGVDVLNYISYSCVIADQWRRSISLLPADDEKVCVGNPALILTDGDPDDQLRSLTRFYDGRQNGAFDADGNLIDDNPHGLQGGPLTGDLRSVIGTVCMSGDDCWNDATVHGLVPGGHHFLVMPEAGGTCSARMEQLELVDAEAGTFYSALLARNPDIFHCTSSKDYFGDFCIGYTRASGFIQNSSDYDLTSEDLAILGSRTQLRQPCSFFGALGADGGGYVCGMRHAADQASVQGVSLLETILFGAPDLYQFSGVDTEDYLPSQFPLDATARNFDIVNANLPPVAAFTPECVELLCTFNASGSDDPDGTIVSYSWDYGDGTSADDAGVGPSHSYAAAGTYTVTLAVTDNEGAIGLVSGSVTVTSGSGNTAPTASFTSECTDLGCTFVASASDDGAIASYRWDFGDGTDPATGENVTHTYAAEGNYNVVLVVTDDLGASTSVTETVAVNAPVVITECTITHSGSFGQGGYSASISWDGNSGSCSVSGKDFSCTMPNVTEGPTPVIFEANKGRDDIYVELDADCSNPDTTGNY